MTEPSPDPKERAAASAPEQEERTRGRGARLLRIGLVAAVVIGAVAALRHPAVRHYLTEEELVALLEAFRSHPLAVPGLILGFVVLASLGTPVTVLLLTSGAVYGVWPGGLYGLVGSVASGIVTYSAVRLLGRELDLDRLGPMRKKVERQLNRHGFWNLVSFRYLPIPYAIANGLLALTGVRFSLFTLSTAVALVPTAFAWAYFAEAIVGASEASRAAAIRNIALGLVGLLLLSLVPEVVRRMRRRRRYRRLLDERRSS